MDNDLRGLEEVTQQLYAAISFTADQPPDWERLEELFVDGGQLARNLASGSEIFTLAGFRDLVEQSRQQGLQAFHEREIDSSTHIDGTMAHRLSRYESNLRDQRVEGVNSIQYFRVQGSWKVLSLAWEAPSGEG